MFGKPSIVWQFLTDLGIRLAQAGASHIAVVRAGYILITVKELSLHRDFEGRKEVLLPGGEERSLREARFLLQVKL